MIIPPIQSFEDFERETLALILPPYVPKFAPITWRDTFAPAQSYPWLVKGVIPCGEAVLKFGATQTGKSFSTQHLSFCIARGLPFFGRRVKRAGVVYVAAEGGKGFRRRQLAYARHHGLGPDDDIPMVVLTRRPDLFTNDADFDAICVEIDHYAATLSHELGLIVLDTWSAATPGVDENAAKDVSKVRQRIMRMVDRFKAAVIVVHHKPASSDKPRGHTSLSADFETTIDVDWDGDARDARGRRVRRAKVAKQREGDTDLEWRFVLAPVRLGTDEEGDEITSCVVEDPEGDVPAGDRTGSGVARPMRPELRIALQCLRDALAEHGEPPIAALHLARSVPAVVHYDYWKRLLVSRVFNPEEATVASTVRSKIKRIGDELLARNVIGKENPYIWIVREPSN